MRSNQGDEWNSEVVEPKSLIETGKGLSKGATKVSYTVGDWTAKGRILADEKCVREEEKEEDEVD